MVVIRATKNVRRLLPATSEEAVESETALGDWYVNRIVVDRRPLLILVSSTSLLSVLTPARSVRTLPSRLAELVAARLGRLGVTPEVIARETAVMADVILAPTIDRSVLGTTVEFGRLIPYHFPEDAWDESFLPHVESVLSRVPSRLRGSGEAYITPKDVAKRVLENRWSSGRVKQ